MNAALSMTTTELIPTPPFDFTKTLRYNGQFRLYRNEPGFEADSLGRAVRINGQTVVCKVVSTGTIDKPRLKVTFYSERPLSSEDVAAAAGRVSFFLSIDDDLAPFYALAEADPPFAPVLENQYGYHQMKFVTPFENACWSIITQRTSFPVASTFKQRIMDRFGGKLVVDGVTYNAFPQPDDFGAADPATLAELVSNERRGQYLHNVVTAFQDVDEMWMRTAEYGEVERWLRSIKGIGEWATYFILLRGLGRTEKVISKDDDSQLIQTTLRAAVPVYGEITPQDVRELAAHYGKYQGYWAHYLRANEA